MPTSPSEPFLDHLSPEHRQLVIKGAEEEEITQTEWIERAVVLRASERGVVHQEDGDHVRSHHARQHEPIVEGLSARHRAMAEAGAAEESITAKEWIERAVVMQAAHRPVRRPAATAHAAAPAATVHAAEAVRGESEEIESRRETERDREAPRPGPRPAEHRAAEHRETEHREAERHEAEHSRPPEHRAERGFSAYHSHMAARAAAAEEVPLDIWMEQAILDRASYRSRGAVRPPPQPTPPPEPAPLPPPPPPAPPPYFYPSPAPPQPAAPGAVVVGQGGGLVVGMLLGVLLAIVLIMFLSWIRTGGRIDTAAVGSGATVLVSSGGAAAPAEKPQQQDQQQQNKQQQDEQQQDQQQRQQQGQLPGPRPRPDEPSHDGSLSGRSAGPNVTVTTQIFEATRTSSPVRRSVRRTRRGGGRSHYGYINDRRRWTDSAASPREEPSRVWTPGCGCDRDVYGRSDDKR